MAITAEIRKRPWLLMGTIAIALLSFLINGDSLDKFFGKNPNIFGKVNGEEITRDEYFDQLYVSQQQAQQQGQPTTGLEEQAWQTLVQSKIIKQQFEKTGLKMTDDFFWSQIQFDPMFAQNPNFKVVDLKKQIENLQKSGDPKGLNEWMKVKKSIEYRMMARQLFANISTGITANKKEAEEIIKQRDQLANIDFVKIDYATYAQKNKVKVTTQDLADYVKKHPIMFKSDATRNLGLVYFPASASAQDNAATLAEINKLYTTGIDNGNGLESFQNTKNDSMFVTVNSELPYTPSYFAQSQLPTGIKDKVASASVGTFFGPYKEQNFYVVSKLIGKKPSDSTNSRHILIGYKGAERSTATRTKEQAKKIADSLLAVIKANPSKFSEGLKLSDEPDAVKRDGSVGWTTPASQFAPGYLQFLANNPKGSTGIAETQFGYHIINVVDKKSGAMTYKIANLVKDIKASKATQDKVYTTANTFIQSAQGKGFNDFVNLAKKGNYNYQNLKDAKRFQGKLPGIGSDKDEEVLTWAFDKKREIGETNIFTSGNGDYIVAYLNGKQDSGTADPESVREKIEPIVKNKIIAKQILDKIAATKATTLDQVAKLFATQKQLGQANLLNAQISGAMEPKVAGAVFGAGVNKVTKPIEGSTGVFVAMNKGVVTNKQPGDVKQITQAIAQQNAQMFGQALIKSLQDNADIKDYRIEVYDKNSKQ